MVLVRCTIARVHNQTTKQLLYTVLLYAVLFMLCCYKQLYAVFYTMLILNRRASSIGTSRSRGSCWGRSSGVTWRCSFRRVAVAEVRSEASDGRLHDRRITVHVVGVGQRQDQSVSPHSSPGAHWDGRGIVLYTCFIWHLAWIIHIVCSGSVLVVTAYDFESGRLGSNPEWGLIYYEASITAQGLQELSSRR